MKIFVSENNDRVEMESIERGFRSDILVEIDGKYYRLAVSTIDRLTQEVKDAFRNSRTYEMNPCQVIVREASLDDIVETILALCNNCFFESFMPVDLGVLYSCGFQYLSNIENWTRIY